ncbi:MAG TPA: hypothetical protein VLY04_24770 [Bryobacteraceae bacterium]|nr:hypothetical protein [Bryobacteraceae bacterium]
MTTKQHLSLHDRQIAAIRALVQEGMRLVVDTRKDPRKLAAELRTQEKLEVLMDTLRRAPTATTSRHASASLQSLTTATPPPA